MLQVGLTGGIGSGKSTVARRLVARGAVLIDADVLARRVVAAGTEGFAAVVAEFGDGVVGPDGELDRPALGAVVFGARDNGTARARLNGIIHPLVRERSAALVAAAPPDAIVVQDIPLLVEGGMAARFPLVVVVHAEADQRVARLVQQRGMSAADARSRIAAQASDDARRAVADVWLDNGAAPADVEAAVDRLWDGRLAPFEANVRARRAATALPRIVAADPGWAVAGARLAARVAAAVGGHRTGVAHVGPTAVPGAPAADVIELQVGPMAPAAGAGLSEALRAAGFVASAPERDGRRFASADPGRPAHMYVRDGEAWRAALLRRDWLRGDPDACAGFVRVLTENAADPAAYAAAAHRWWRDATDRVGRWVASSGWVPSLQ
ncbi:MAG: dephospho-CoA kinase [Pseudonocardia sp.]|nr:dephospho-CoA kinase [Pseudonocardia sp.]